MSAGGLQSGDCMPTPQGGSGGEPQVPPDLAGWAMLKALMSHKVDVPDSALSKAVSEAVAVLESSKKRRPREIDAASRFLLSCKQYNLSCEENTRKYAELALRARESDELIQLLTGLEEDLGCGDQSDD